MLPLLYTFPLMRATYENLSTEERLSRFAPRKGAD
jgi:hypothetical protein